MATQTCYVVLENATKIPKDTSISKVQSSTSPHGKMGQKYLCTGKNIEMRIWEDIKSEQKSSQPTLRAYETVGYVIKGRAELHLEGQLIILNPGDSWLVPKGATHYYKILEDFTAVEATSPPASVHGRDE